MSLGAARQAEPRPLAFYRSPTPLRLTRSAFDAETGALLYAYDTAREFGP